MSRPIALIVDGHNMIHRGFWAVKEQLTAPDGTPTNAIKGMVNILLAEIKKVEATHCAIIFDSGMDEFRASLYPEYKAGRPHNDDLAVQIKYAKRLLKYAGIKVYCERGVEGDDLSGSIAVSASSEGALSVITSSDKDFLQLVRDDKIHILPPKSDDHYGSEHVVERLGIKPKYVIDYLMLLGDGVDNIPGVYKVGPAKAKELVNRFGRAGRIVRHADELTPALKKNILEAAPQFKLTRKLITIRTDRVPDFKLEDIEFQSGDDKKLKKLCNRLGLHATYNLIKSRL